MNSSRAEPGPSGLRQPLLARLAMVLDSLGRKLGAQRGMMLDACALAPRAEEVAIRARLLAFGCGDASAATATALAADIGALAATAGSLAARAEETAAAGGRMGEAITGQAAALSALASDPAAPPEPAGLRRILAPLLGALEALPKHREEQAAVGAGLSRLAAQAEPLAERAGRLSGGGTAGAATGEEALRLSRDLAALAAAATELAAEIDRDAGGGDPLAEAMAGQIRGMATALPDPVPVGAPPGRVAPRRGALAEPDLRAVAVLPLAMPPRRFGRAPG